MPGSIDDLVRTGQNAVTAINDLNVALKAFFPQAAAVSTAAPAAGTITFTSSQARGFLTVTTSSGFSAVVPLY